MIRERQSLSCCCELFESPGWSLTCSSEGRCAASNCMRTALRSWEVLLLAASFSREAATLFLRSRSRCCAARSMWYARRKAARKLNSFIASVFPPKVPLGSSFASNSCFMRFNSRSSINFSTRLPSSSKFKRFNFCAGVSHFQTYILSNFSCT